MKSNEEQLRSRGYIEDNELEQYSHLTRLQLIELLQSNIASERTIGARLSIA